MGQMTAVTYARYVGFRGLALVRFVVALKVIHAAQALHALADDAETWGFAETERLERARPGSRFRAGRRWVRAMRVVFSDRAAYALLAFTAVLLGLLFIAQVGHWMRAELEAVGWCTGGALAELREQGPRALYEAVVMHCASR